MKKKTIVTLGALACSFMLMSSLIVAQETINNQDETVVIDADEFMNRGAPGRGTRDANIVGAGGSAEGRDGILTIYRSNVKKDVQNYIVKLFELKQGNCSEVKKYVEKALELENGNAKSLKYPDPQTGITRHFLEVVTTEAQMPYIEELIKGLDLAGIVETGNDPKYDVRMRYRRASEVAEILSALRVDGIYADDASNTLHFEDDPSKINVMDFYDVPPLQIQFEVQLLVIKDSNISKLGVDWAAWKKSFSGEIQSVGNVLESVSENTRADWIFGMQGPALADFLNYTTQSGTIEVKQRIKLNANNLAPAVLVNSRMLPYYDYVNTSDDSHGIVRDTAHETAPDNVVEIGPEYARWEKQLIEENEVGLAISITPVIGMDLVTADVQIEAAGVSDLDEMSRPIIQRQEFNTAITLKHMQPLYVGAVEQANVVESRRGIPGFMKIPVLKHLFSVENKVIENSTIHIVVTPCYCETVSYEARIRGGAGDILKINETLIPSYVSREMMPAASGAAAKEKMAK